MQPVLPPLGGAVAPVTGKGGGGSGGGRPEGQEGPPGGPPGGGPGIPPGVPLTGGVGAPGGRAPGPRPVPKGLCVGKLGGDGGRAAQDGGVEMLRHCLGAAVPPQAPPAS
eukprot:2116737-Ditylum_brightwellii.AAC.1